MTTTTPKIKLTYFDIEGVAESIRLAFSLAGVEYEWVSPLSFAKLR